jgi:hypothetical protein
VSDFHTVTSWLTPVAGPASLQLWSISRLRSFCRNAKQSALERVVSYGLERGLRENGSVSGAKSQEGCACSAEAEGLSERYMRFLESGPACHVLSDMAALSPFKILRRQNGPFSPNPSDAAYFVAECVENARDTLGITCAFRLYSNKIRLAPRPIDN